MNLELIEEKSPVLHRKLKPVDEITPEIKELISNMKKTMIENGGVGLSANQIGKDLQIFVILEEVAKEHEAPSVYINPELKSESKDEWYLEEGCLSIPGYIKEMSRPKKVWVKAMDENGEKHRFKATGFLARVIQHEYDHLNGVLIKDKK